LNIWKIWWIMERGLNWAGPLSIVACCHFELSRGPTHWPFPSTPCVDQRPRRLRHVAARPQSWPVSPTIFPNLAPSWPSHMRRPWLPYPLWGFDEEANFFSIAATLTPAACSAALDGAGAAAPSHCPPPPTRLWQVELLVTISMPHSSNWRTTCPLRRRCPGVSSAARGNSPPTDCLQPWTTPPPPPRGLHRRPTPLWLLQRFSWALVHAVAERLIADSLLRPIPILADSSTSTAPPGSPSTSTLAMASIDPLAPHRRSPAARSHRVESPSPLGFLPPLPQTHCPTSPASCSTSCPPPSHRLDGVYPVPPPPAAPWSPSPVSSSGCEPYSIWVGRPNENSVLKQWQL
jgi:hypothetical protein